MKKIISTLLVISLLFCFTACKNSNNEVEETATSATEKQTTERVEKTTAKPTDDKAKGSELKATVEAIFSDSKGSEISGDFSKGSFQVKYNRDASVVYANEREDSIENNAKANAKELVEEIKSFYGDKITLESFEAEEVSFGENGIDSVRYTATYVNTQNQALTIIIDSDATISFVDCSFTW